MTTEYQIEYHTHNVYEYMVSEAFYEFLVVSCADETQKVTKVQFSNNLNVDVFHHTNPFGFKATGLRTTKPFKEFELWMRATVEKSQPVLPQPGQLSVAEELTMLSDYGFYVENYHFLEFSKYTTIADKYADRMLYRREGQSTFDYLKELNTYIYGMLEFDPEPTNVHTTATDVIELGKGVCQDYTHVFLAIARTNKIPCRYVSGYLNQGNNLAGSAVMHAWAEAFIPGYGWFGFDPTNNLLADVNHIKAAHGTDYSDCPPIRGVIISSGNHHTDYEVKVIPHVLETSAQ